MSRTYADRLDAAAVEFLTQRCPADLVDRFQSLPADPYEVTTAVGGTTWFTQDACLGSARETFAWTQRRPLLGYWSTDDDPAVVLRARVLLNGHDLSAACCRQAQRGSRVLSAWWLTYDGGDFHPTLDRPEGSVYPVGDLRLSVSLSGSGVHGHDAGGGRFVLAAGKWRALITTAPAEFMGRSVEWRLREEDDQVSVDAVLHEGQEERVDFHLASLRLAFGLELADHELFCEAVTDERPLWRWGGLSVSTPTSPTAFKAI